MRVKREETVSLRLREEAARSSRAQSLQARGLAEKIAQSLTFGECLFSFLSVQFRYCRKRAIFV